MIQSSQINHKTFGGLVWSRNGCLWLYYNVHYEAWLQQQFCHWRLDCCCCQHLVVDGSGWSSKGCNIIYLIQPSFATTELPYQYHCSSERVWSLLCWSRFWMILSTRRCWQQQQLSEPQLLHIEFATLIWGNFSIISLRIGLVVDEIIKWCN